MVSSDGMSKSSSQLDAPSGGNGQVGEKAGNASSSFQKKFFEMAEEGWWSSGDVAKFLSVTPNAVRIMVCRGILPATKMRGRLRFRKKDCAALFEKKESKKWQSK